MTLSAKIEALLYLSTKPLSLKKIQALTGQKISIVKKTINQMMDYYNHPQKGIHIQKIGDKIQFVTNPSAHKLVESFINDELKAELTRPALETLTIIAYRGPIFKSELELIRGVNCSLILRNLMIRGLVVEEKDKKSGLPRYQVTFDFLQYLGVNKQDELPQYEEFSQDEIIEKLLVQQAE